MTSDRPDPAGAGHGLIGFLIDDDVALTRRMGYTIDIMPFPCQDWHWRKWRHGFKPRSPRDGPGVQRNWQASTERPDKADAPECHRECLIDDVVLTPGQMDDA